jgi:hypothetical protein
MTSKQTVGIESNIYSKKKLIYESETLINSNNERNDIVLNFNSREKYTGVTTHRGHSFV